ncbi:MAG TPA: hypothetical protein VE685_11495 [Thermoanaerobaculia bacterium]|nr:hypothetical protein [Thermoanaerobaculia bacterium]
MNRLLKLALTLMLATLAIFASLNITAQPAHAVNCFRSFMGCTFSGYTYIDVYECCTYACPDGTEKIGACGTAWAD